MTQRILITGIGGPAAIGCFEALGEGDVYVGDMNARAPGMFLVPPERRVTLHAGADPEFADHLLALCIGHSIDILIPTVDAELIPIAESAHRFREAGVQVVLPDPAVLRSCLDKFQLFMATRSTVPVPHTEIFGRHFDDTNWRYPLIVKPRRGSGSRGVVIVESKEELDALPRSPDLIVQEYLPGEEYSVDVLADGRGRMLTAVPRVRIATDSGVSVCSVTVHDPELMDLAERVCRATRLKYVNNIQFRRDATGRARLLEVNPRIPGTISLTVASGPNLPRLALDVMNNRVIADADLKFREMGVVRYLTEVFVSKEELTGQSAVSQPPALPEAVLL